MTDPADPVDTLIARAQAMAQRCATDRAERRARAEQAAQERQLEASAPHPQHTINDMQPQEDM